jgi:hypothetical protein
LKINKEIIQNFYKASFVQDDNFYLKKLKEENDNIYAESKNLKEEIVSLRSKISFLENILNDSITSYRESTESLENKIFILENSIIKKDNLIQCIMPKLNKKYEKEENENLREIYVNFFYLDN